MPDRRKTTPPAADPRPGRNPGYAETQPRDPGDVRHPAPEPKPKPSPDAPGMDYDADAPPDPADD